MKMKFAFPANVPDNFLAEDKQRGGKIVKQFPFGEGNNFLHKQWSAHIYDCVF